MKIIDDIDYGGTVKLDGCFCSSGSVLSLVKGAVGQECRCSCQHGGENHQANHNSGNVG